MRCFPLVPVRSKSEALLRACLGQATLQNAKSQIRTTIPWISNHKASGAFTASSNFHNQKRWAGDTAIKSEPVDGDQNKGAEQEIVLENESSEKRSEGESQTSPATSAAGSTEPTPSLKSTPVIPKPTPFVPDVKTFLSLIGRDLIKYEEKFPTWEALFGLKSSELKELGIEPPRLRKYLLKWRRNFVTGMYGPCGDAKYVKDGKVFIQVVERDSQKLAVNVPAGTKPEDVKDDQMTWVKGYSVSRKSGALKGPYLLPAAKDCGCVTVTPNMWEIKRGVKIDGGERRRAMVRFHKKIAARKQAKEKTSGQKK